MRILLLFLALFANRAQGAVFLEPDIGYEAGRLGESFTHSNTGTEHIGGSGGGFTFGARAGVETANWMAGALFNKGRMARAGVPTDAGLFAGVAIPAGIQAWFGYLISSKTTRETGTGFEIGLGIPVARYFYLNTEYVQRSFNAFTGVHIPFNTFSGDLKTFRISVSLPLSYEL
jgi:hypothetical protein